MDLPPTLIPVFHNFKVLVKVFTLLVTDISKIFFEIGPTTREFSVPTMLTQQELKHFKINTYDPFVFLIFI